MSSEGHFRESRRLSEMSLYGTHIRVPSWIKIDSQKQASIWWPERDMEERECVCLFFIIVRLCVNWCISTLCWFNRIYQTGPNQEWTTNLFVFVCIRSKNLNILWYLHGIEGEVQRINNRKVLHRIKFHWVFIGLHVLLNIISCVYDWSVSVEKNCNSKSSKLSELDPLKCVTTV